MQAQLTPQHTTSVTQTWNFTMPPTSKRGQTLQLLTIGGVSVIGNWHGQLGSYFVAWADRIVVSPKDQAQFDAIINQTTSQSNQATNQSYKSPMNHPDHTDNQTAVKRSLVDEEFIDNFNEDDAQIPGAILNADKDGFDE